MFIHALDTDAILTYLCRVKRMDENICDIFHLKTARMPEKHFKTFSQFKMLRAKEVHRTIKASASAPHQRDPIFKTPRNLYETVQF